MTGLPEYRNGKGVFLRLQLNAGSSICLVGGLLVDTGVLSLRPGALDASVYDSATGLPKLPPSHPAIIEWRAMTVIELCVFLIPDVRVGQSELLRAAFV